MVQHHFVPGIKNKCDGQDRHLSTCEAGILVGVEIVALKKKKGKTNNFIPGAGGGGIYSENKTGLVDGMSDWKGLSEEVTFELRPEPQAPAI